MDLSSRPTLAILMFTQDQQGPMARIRPLCGTLHRKLIASMVIITILLTIHVVSPVSGNEEPTITWSRTYGPNNGVFSIQGTSDGGFVASGHGYGGEVIKASLAGEPEWSKYYIPMGHGDADLGGSVRQTRDGGFIVAGAVAEPVEAWLLKLDHNGNVQWSRTYKGYGFSQIKETSDGQYIVAGSAIGPDPSDGWVLKLDPEGNIVWQEMFRDQDINYVEQTRDGGYIVAGTVGVDSMAEAWIFKLDPAGNMVWQRAFEVNSPQYNQAIFVRQTHDGGYIVVGAVNFLFQDTLILRLDRNGNILWQKLYSRGGITSPVWVGETSGGGFLLAGRFSYISPTNGIAGAWILKVDKNGNKVWDKVYGGLNDLFFLADATRSGGLIAVGATGGGATWVLKLDDQGSIAGCPLGRPANATLTDTYATTTNTSITPVSTNATVTQTGVTALVHYPGVQTQCIGSMDRDHESDRDKHYLDSRGTEKEQFHAFP